MGPCPLPPPMRGSQHGAGRSRANGFAEFIAITKLEGPVVGQLFADVVAAGAVDVSELGPLDWPQLPSWKSRRPLEARRPRCSRWTIGRRAAVADGFLMKSSWCLEMHCRLEHALCCGAMPWWWWWRWVPGEGTMGTGRRHSKQN